MLKIRQGSKFCSWQNITKIIKPSFKSAKCSANYSKEFLVKLYCTASAF